MNKYVYENVSEIPFAYLTKDNDIKEYLHNSADMRSVNINGVINALYPVFDERMPRGKHGVWWVCACKCGKYTITSDSNLKKNSFHSCGCSRMMGAKKKCGQAPVDYTGELYGNLLAIERVGITKDKKHSIWRFLNIETGEFKECNIGNVRKGDSLGLKVLSRGEKMIEEWLSAMNIEYDHHKKFTDCRFKDTNALAEFDFYLPGYNVVIEYDGIQHFQPTSFHSKDAEGFFNYIKRHDNFKEAYCKDNNIKMIRVPYTMSDVDCIGKILSVLLSA